METTTFTTRDGSAVATEFLDALARQDWVAVQSVLDKRVSFRVLTPRALREAADDSGAMAWLTRWFGDSDHLTVLHSDSSMLHDRIGISYRFRVHKDGWYVIEQRGYADVVDGRITSLSLVCSGFRPA